MSQQDDDFTQVLERLHGVRDELSATSNPERVAVLRELAGELVARGRGVLSRSLGDPVGAEPEEPVHDPRPDPQPDAPSDPQPDAEAGPTSAMVVPEPVGEAQPEARRPPTT